MWAGEGFTKKNFYWEAGVTTLESTLLISQEWKQGSGKLE